MLTMFKPRVVKFRISGIEELKPRDEDPFSYVMDGICAFGVKYLYGEELELLESRRIWVEYSDI